MMRIWSGLGMFAALTALGGLAACHGLPGHNRNKLWELVGSRCATDGQHRPCTVYEPQKGYALLKDLEGRGQYLLIPTKKVLGVEDPFLFQPDVPDYFGEAWGERARVAQAYGFPVSDMDLSMAINSHPGRSQDQLHIHLDCLTPYARRVIDKTMIGTDWTPVSLYGHAYRAKIVPSLDVSPFRLVGAEGLERHTIVVTPARHGGFVVLDDVAHALDRASGEELQDHKCQIDDPAFRAAHPDGVEPGSHMNGMM